MPLSIVDDETFRLLFTAVGSAYKPPCRQTITNRILELYESEKKYVYSKVNEEAESIAITLDGWTSTATQAYMCVTGHYLTSAFQVNSVCLDVIRLEGPHTGDNIANNVINKVKESLTVSIISATTDNASNMSNAVSKTSVEHHVCCAAHTIQLSIKVYIEKDLLELVTKLRKFVGHFSHSTQARDALNAVQQRIYSNEEKFQPLQLVQDVVTRWNSTYMMIERLIELKTAIIIWQEETDFENSITAVEWEQVQLLYVFLQPFMDFTTRVSGQTYPTISSVYTMIRVLLHHLGEKSSQPPEVLYYNHFC